MLLPKYKHLHPDRQQLLEEEISSVQFECFCVWVFMYGRVCIYVLACVLFSVCVCVSV